MSIKRVTTEYRIKDFGLEIVVQPSSNGTFIEQKNGEDKKIDRVYVHHGAELADLIDVLLEIQNGHE